MTNISEQIQAIKVILTSLRKEYVELQIALDNASPEFKKLLSIDEVKYSVIHELIDYKEYNLITDEIKVKQAFIDLLSGDLL